MRRLATSAGRGALAAAQRRPGAAALSVVLLVLLALRLAPASAGWRATGALRGAPLLTNGAEAASGAHAGAPEAAAAAAAHAGGATEATPAAAAAPSPPEELLCNSRTGRCTPRAGVSAAALAQMQALAFEAAAAAAADATAAPGDGTAAGGRLAPETASTSLALLRRVAEGAGGTPEDRAEAARLHAELSAPREAGRRRHRRRRAVAAASGSGAAAGAMAAESLDAPSAAAAAAGEALFASAKQTALAAIAAGLKSDALPRAFVGDGAPRGGGEGGSAGGGGEPGVAVRRLPPGTAYLRPFSAIPHEGMRAAREVLEAHLGSDAFAARVAAIAAAAAASSGERHRGKGILINAGGRGLLTHLVVLLRVLRRRLNCTLPVEVAWHGAAEMDAPTLQALASEFGPLYGFDVSSVPYPGHHRPGVDLKRWVGKSFALLHTRFAEVILLDSDSLPLRDPSWLFESPQYARSGDLFFPDFWRGWVKDGAYAAAGLDPPLAQLALGDGKGAGRRDAETGAAAASSRRPPSLPLPPPAAAGRRQTRTSHLR